MSRGEKVKEKADAQIAIDDVLYELPDNSELELGDGLLETLVDNAENLLQADSITNKEEEDLILEKIKDEYSFEDIKDSLDEENVPENIFVSMVMKVTTFIAPLNL